MARFHNSQNRHRGIFYLINFGLSNHRVTQIRYGLATVLSISLIYFSQTNKKEIEFIQSYAVFTCNSIINIFYSPVTFIKYSINLAADMSLVYKENSKLREENKKMEEYMILKELERHKHYDTQNLLQKNLGISHNVQNFEVSYISKQSGVAIIKTKGVRIEENSSVLCSSGLAGRVIFSDENIAKVILINDEKSFIPVTTSISASRGILKNDIEAGLEIIGFEIPPKIGEIVYTMSTDTAFLSGVPVGIIYKSDNQKVLVKAICDATKSNFLSVIR